MRGYRAARVFHGVARADVTPTVAIQGKKNGRSEEMSGLGQHPLGAQRCLRLSVVLQHDRALLSGFTLPRHLV